MKKLTIILSFIFASMAQAETVSNNLNVSGTVSHSCTMAVTDVNFGIYDQSVELKASNSFNIKCTKGSPYILETHSSGYGHDIDIPITNNLVHGGTYSTMVSTEDSTQKLYYQMHMPWTNNPNFWNDDMNIEQEFYRAIGNGETQTLTVNYRLESRQYVRPGNYVGTQSVVLNF